MLLANNLLVQTVSESFFMGHPMLLRQEVTAFIHRKHCQSHSQACQLTKPRKQLLKGK